MNTVFVLIMVITSNRYAVTSITQEFGSFEACEFARQHTVSSVTKNVNYGVVSQGCVKK